MEQTRAVHDVIKAIRGSGYFVNWIPPTPGSDEPYRFTALAESGQQWTVRGADPLHAVV